MTDMKSEAWLKARYDALAAPDRPGYALVSLKLKRFRLFNRLYGRAAGDMLIEKVYEAIAGFLAPDECAARIYLDYYNLLLRVPPDYDGIFDRMVHLNSAIRDMPDERFQGKAFSGIGVFHLSEEPVDFYDAQYKADLCRVECPQREFYHSHVEVYGLTYHEPVTTSMALHDQVLEALSAGHIKLYLQPKVNLKTGRVESAEALMRWIDPVRGMLPLSEFLPGLEENGHIEDVDLYLFGQVCDHIRRWLDEYGVKIKISVNMSGCAFSYARFLDDYREVYERFPCPKDCVEIELLERIVLNQAERVREVVEQFRAFGFSCSLDDFGSGFSSYSVLTTADLSTLKLDRSLFQDEHNERERVLLRHIVATAHDIGMSVVAEGVETPGYVRYLREIGCDYVQGFVFYRPMPVEEFEARFVRDGEHPSLPL